LDKEGEGGCKGEGETINLLDLGFVETFYNLPKGYQAKEK